MRVQGSLEPQIKKAAIDFTTNHMSLTPEAVFVHIDEQNIVITLHGITCPAEKEYAREKQSRAILKGLYDEVFEVNHYILESIIENIIGQRIEHSRLTVDPDTGNGVIMLIIAG